MPTLLLVNETLVAEGAAFMRNAVADSGAAQPAVRLARRLVLLQFALRSLHAGLASRLHSADAAAPREFGRCIACVQRELDAVARELGVLGAVASAPLLEVARPLPAPTPAPVVACRRVQTELRIVAALARSAGETAFALWAERRAQRYLRCGVGERSSKTRTRSRGISSLTSATRADSAALRG